MPIPKLLTAREFLEATRYNCEGKSPQAIYNAAMRRARKLKIKCKDVRPRLWYAASVEQALASQPDHQFA